jgi:hypothetical protein
LLRLGGLHLKITALAKQPHVLGRQCVCCCSSVGRREEAGSINKPVDQREHGILLPRYLAARVCVCEREIARDGVREASKVSLSRSLTHSLSQWNVPAVPLERYCRKQQL